MGNDGTSRFAKVMEVGVGRRSIHSNSSRTNNVASVNGFSF